MVGAEKPVACARIRKAGWWGYKKDEKDEAAKSLEEWGEQNWQTAEGKGTSASGWQDETVFARRSVEKAPPSRRNRKLNAARKRLQKQGEQYVDMDSGY